MLWGIGLVEMGTGAFAAIILGLIGVVTVMRSVPEARRGAHFICVLVLLAGGQEQVFEGVCGGRLLEEPRGGAGFGYDPLFVPDGFTESFAELGEDVKNQISHRAKALGKLKAFLTTK